MKNLFLFALLAACTSGAFSQHIISGSVSNETGEPVAGAAIQIQGTFSGTLSDGEGKFSLASKKETATLVISHLNYETLEAEARQGGDLTFTLKTKVFLADEVIVSATRAENTNTSADKILEEYISGSNLSQDMPYLLEQSPSIVATSDAGAGVGYTYLRIRGSNQSRINVTLNGIPYNEPESQEVYWVDLPDFASSVDNIFIQRGVGTSTNGAAAFGGSINIQTHGLQKEPYGELSASYGSYNTWKTTARFGTGLLKKKFTIDARLSQVKSDGYIERTNSDLKAYFLSGAYYGSKTILRVNVFSGLEETYQAWWGVPESYLDTNRTYNYYNYPDEVDHYLQTHHQVLFSQKTGKWWNVNSALHYTRGKGYYEQYRGPEYNNDFGFNSKDAFSDYGLTNLVLDDTTITETSLVRRRWLDNHFYGVTFSALYKKSKTEITLGGAANRYNGNHYGEIIWAEYAANIPKDYRYYDGDGTKNDANVFVKANYRLKKFDLFADLQYRFVSHEIAGTDNDLRFLALVKHHHFFNPKAGLLFKLNSVHGLSATVSIGNREPARADYTDAPANRLPEPERLRDLEIGYRFTKAKNVFTLNCYFMHYKNQLVQTGELNDVGSPIKINADKSYRTGIEIVNSFQPFEKLRWDANVTFSINKIKNFTEVLYAYDGNYNFLETVMNHYANTDISFSPFAIASSTILYKPLPALQLALINKYVSKQYLDNTGSEERSLDGFFLGNFRISYLLKEKFFREIVFTVLVNNIFSTKYESNGYTFGEIYEDNSGEKTRVDYNYYYPQAGFNAMGGVTVKF